MSLKGGVDPVIESMRKEDSLCGFIFQSPSCLPFPPQWGAAMHPRCASICCLKRTANSQMMCAWPGFVHTHTQWLGKIIVKVCISTLSTSPALKETIFAATPISSTPQCSRMQISYCAWSHREQSKRILFGHWKGIKCWGRGLRPWLHYSFFFCCCYLQKKIK